MFLEMRFDLGTLDSGERSLPFGLLVRVYRVMKLVGEAKLPQEAPHPYASFRDKG